VIALAVAGALLATLGFVGALAIALRHHAYTRQISYDPRQNCILGMAGPAIENILLLQEKRGFVLPPADGAVSGLVELKVRASLAGRLADPAIEIRAAGFHDVQYLERGARGTRFLNVSRMLESKADGRRVYLKGRGLRWGSVKGLHRCKERPRSQDRVLVVAPHPDDAEIAAFGLYADTRSTVVTLTAGDASDRYQSSACPWLTLSRSTVAALRVWDSLTVPQLGGVAPERAINLCMPDGRLSEMYRLPDRDFRTQEPDVPDFPALRQMNRSALVQGGAECSWKMLVDDLARIVADVSPTIVVAPHPRLDPHPDHLFTTVAIIQALQAAGLTVPRLYLYTVHNRRSELWPFGPAGSGVALLPILPDDGLCASAFYSHRLSGERQRQKFVALEAMHDVRDVQWPAPSSHQQTGRRVAAELRALVHGMGRMPTSYLRRAVRPDEWFFMTSLEDCIALIDRALAPASQSGNGSGSDG
jgi:LmbE family N-acetylglucosaminyl deacetylase